MKEEIKELSILLESIIVSNKLELNSDSELKINDIIKKIRTIQENMSIEDIKKSLDSNHLNDLLERIIDKQKKNSKIFEEFKNFIEKKK